MPYLLLLMCVHRKECGVRMDVVIKAGLIRVL